MNTDLPNEKINSISSPDDSNTNENQNLNINPDNATTNTPEYIYNAYTYQIQTPNQDDANNILKNNQCGDYTGVDYAKRQEIIPPPPVLITNNARNTTVNNNNNPPGLIRTSTFNQYYQPHSYWSLIENSQGFFGKIRKLIFEYHQICFPIYCFLSFAFILSIIFISYYNKRGLRNFSGTLSTIQKNIDSQPIADIVIIPAGSPCPNGYSLLSLGMWPGIDNYCYCGDSYYGSTDYVSGSCSSKQRTRGCKTIDAQGSQNYYIWKDNSFCVQYANPPLILLNCPIGFINCYTGGCYSIIQGCPITNIAYSPLTSTIIVIRDGISPPFIGLQISMNGLPCLDSSTAPIFKNYPPLSSLDPVGCAYIDPGANYIIDQYDQISLMNANGLSNKFSILGYQATLQNSQANLVLMQKYSVKNLDVCLGLTSSCFVTMNNTINGYLDSFFAFNIGTAVCLFIWLTCFYSGRRVRNNDNCLKDKESLSIFMHFILVFVFYLGTVLIVFILEVILIQKHINSRDTIASCYNNIYIYIANNCYDQRINDSLTHFSTLWNSNTKDIIGLTAAALSISCLFLPLHLIYCINYFKKRPINAS